MTDPSPRLAWWKRKRTWAALALWGVIAYPLSAGPWAYANARGWLPPSAVGPLGFLYAPLDYVLANDLPGAGPLTDYSVWAEQLAERHAASD